VHSLNSSNDVGKISMISAYSCVINYFVSLAYVSNFKIINTQKPTLCEYYARNY